MEKKQQQLFFQGANNMIINKNAPIIPYEGLGGIKLYSTIDDLKDLLLVEDVSSIVINDKWLRYDIQNCIELFFHLDNKKLFRLTTLDAYKGKLLGKIGVGTSEKEMLDAEPTFQYDEFEEVWESIKGVFIEMDAETNTVRWISVYIPELNAETFDQCQW
jgi:hypothetical protein